MATVQITAADIIATLDTNRPYTLSAVEVGLCRLALKRSDWCVSRASKLLGISRTALSRRMIKHRIKDMRGTIEDRTGK